MNHECMATAQKGKCIWHLRGSTWMWHWGTKFPFNRQSKSLVTVGKLRLELDLGQRGSAVTSPFTHAHIHTPVLVLHLPRLRERHIPSLQQVTSFGDHHETASSDFKLKYVETTEQVSEAGKHFKDLTLYLCAHKCQNSSSQESYYLLWQESCGPIVGYPDWQSSLRDFSPIEQSNLFWIYFILKNNNF